MQLFKFLSITKLLECNVYRNLRVPFVTMFPMLPFWTMLFANMLKVHIL